MSAVGDVLNLWKSFAERKGKSREEIADYLDSVAEEAAALADAARDAMAADLEPASRDRLEARIAQYCGALKSVYQDASLVLAKHPEVRDSLVERIARVRMAPTSLREQMRQVGYEQPKVLTGVDSLTLAVLDAELVRPDFPQAQDRFRNRLKSAVVTLNEEAGELRMFAATYRSTGRASR
jgi:broad-specificity NMP kinase